MSIDEELNFGTFSLIPASWSQRGPSYSAVQWHVSGPMHDPFDASPQLLTPEQSGMSQSDPPHCGSQVHVSKVRHLP